MRKTNLKLATLGVVVSATALLFIATSAPLYASGDHDTQKTTSHNEISSSGKMMTSGMSMGRLMMPRMDPENGKKVFINKGCIACHAINGIGGRDAPAMDAHEMDTNMNPFEFAARMWNHAPGMIAAQEDAFGEMIKLNGQEIADIIAFVHNDDSQHGFSKDNLTPMARQMMEHEHGSMMSSESHAEETGHGHGEDDGHGEN